MNIRITPVTRHQYNLITAERAIEGLGPFCGSYEAYLAFVEKHNATVK